MKIKTILSLFFIILPFFILVLLFELMPLTLILIHSITNEEGSLSLQNFYEIFSSAFYLQSIKQSFEITILSSFFGLLIAFLGSYSLYKLKENRISKFILSVSSMTSNFAGVPLAFACIIMIGANGIINILLKKLGNNFIINLSSKSGIIMVYTYFQIPLAILLLYPAFSSLKSQCKEAASLLGANLMQYWRYIGIPILMPAISGTFIILFANALSAYTTIYALTSGNFNVLPIRIGSLVYGDLSLDPYMASSLSIIVIIIMLIIVLIQRQISKRFNYSV